MPEREYEVKPFDQNEWNKIYSFNIDTKILKDQTPFKIPDNYVFEASIYNCINNSINNSIQCSKVIQIKIFDKSNTKYKVHYTFVVSRAYYFLPPLIYVKQNEKEYIITFSDELCIGIICLNDGYVKSCSYKDSIHSIDFWPLEMFIELDNKHPNSFKIKILGYDYISKCYQYFCSKNIDIENFSIQQNIELMELYGDENNQFNYASID